MQADQKKQVILRLLAVGGPVLLTLILLAVTITRLTASGGSDDSMSVSNVAKIAENQFNATKSNHANKKLQNQNSGAESFSISQAASSSHLSNRGLSEAGPQLSPASGGDFSPEVHRRSQPLSEALEAMVEQESNDPLGDDLFLNTTSLDKLNKQLIPEVRAGFSLGKSGAIYAAREQFIYVLRRIAVAKDVKEQSDRHMKALASGLRALDESDDFLPRGDSIESEIDTLAISATHTTPVLHRPMSKPMSVSKSQSMIYDNVAPAAPTPHEASAEYARYASQQLSEAMADEEAGSMALYGLGKTYARLESQSKEPTASLKCNVMYRAAAVAHPENYLAANELGVRLAKAGKYESAQKVLQLAARQPANAKVFENLALVEQKLGNASRAQQVQIVGQQIAMRERQQSEVSRRHGVAWVSPDEFRRMGPNNRTTIARSTTEPISQQMSPSSAQQPIPQRQMPDPGTATQGGLKTAFNYLKRATGWNKSEAKVPNEVVPIDRRSDNQLARRPVPIQPSVQPASQQPVRAYY